jgi:hypothetical protein
VRLAAQEHGIEGGHPAGFVALGHVAQRLAISPARIRKTSASSTSTAPVAGLEHGVDAAQQGGLAHAVGAENGQHLAAVHAEVQPLQDLPAVVADVDVPDV